MTEKSKPEKITLPDQRPGESIEEYIERTWKADAGLRQEFFNDLESYKSYCKAEAAGRVKVLNQL